MEKMMEINTMAFITGAIFLIAGIVGGGIEIKELKIPSISKLPRILSFMSGVALIMTSLILSGFSKYFTDDNEEISFTIETDINPHKGNKEKENVLDIYIDAKPIAKIYVNEKNPFAIFPGKVSKIGEYNYSIGGHTVFMSAPDYSYPVEGSGKINIHKNGISFEIRAIAPYSLFSENERSSLRVMLVEKKH